MGPCGADNPSGAGSMIKMVVLVRRRPDLDQRAFADYWIQRHAPLAAQIPGMRGYRINVARDSQLEEGRAPWDGSAEIWFDNRASLDAGLASPEGQIAGDDVANFAERLEFLLTDETVILPRK